MLIKNEGPASDASRYRAGSPNNFHNGRSKFGQRFQSRLAILDEAITAAALKIRADALAAGFVDAAAWRVADAIVKAATGALAEPDWAPTGAAATRADDRCELLYPPLPIGREEIVAVHTHMATRRQRVEQARLQPATPRVRSVAVDPIEQSWGGA